MSREKRTPKGDAGSSQEWGIVARFADGSGAYYYVDERHRDDRGNAAERWGRESQAHRFRSEGEARRVASGMQMNRLLAIDPRNDHLRSLMDVWWDDPKYRDLRMDGWLGNTLPPWGLLATDAPSDKG